MAKRKPIAWQETIEGYCHPLDIWKPVSYELDDKHAVQKFYGCNLWRYKGRRDRKFRGTINVEELPGDSSTNQRPRAAKG